MEAVVHGRGLGQRYGRRWVFQGLDIAVNRGVTTLLGPNGAGKTTLLHTLVGLRRPARGCLRILDIDVLRRDGRRRAAARLGFLPQTVGIVPGYTLADYVGYAAWLKGVPNGQLGARVATALGRVGLGARADTKMRTLSGGMLRRAGIAQALVSEPDVLILDEPSAGLDPEQRIDLRRLIKDLAEVSCVLVSTHLVEDVRHVGDHVLVLVDGEITFSGTVAELAAARTAGADGDTDIERGYLAVSRRRATAGRR